MFNGKLKIQKEAEAETKFVFDEKMLLFHFQTVRSFGI